MLKKKIGVIAASIMLSQVGFAATYHISDFKDQPTLRLITIDATLFNSSNAKTVGMQELNWLHTQLESIRTNKQGAVLQIQDNNVKNIQGKLTLNNNAWDHTCLTRFKNEIANYNQEIQAVITPVQSQEHQALMAVSNNKLAPIVANSAANTINFMTFNIGSLPTIFGIQIANADFLRPNVERVTEIAKVLNQWNQTGNQGASHIVPNIIAFEESFDPDVRSYLKAQLAHYYPYNSGDIGQKFLNAGSGLLFFSQYPILEMTFHPYTNLMVGEETLANKGFITAKLKVDDSHFITVIATHLEAGGAIWKDQQEKDGTTSVRRGVQMGEIYNELQTVASTPPRGYENLIYLKSFVMGDFNATLNNEREQKSISTGLSDNGFKSGDIKYPGQYWLFTALHNTVPTNFIEVRQLPTTKGAGKTVDPVLLQQAIQQNLFTGSTLPDDLLKPNRANATALTRQGTEYKMIDGIFESHDGVNGDITTYITSLNESSPYRYSMSDHLATLGRFSY